MTPAELKRKPTKTLILLCTLKRCFKGGKKAAEKKTRPQLITAAAKAYKVKGIGKKTAVKISPTRVEKYCTTSHDRKGHDRMLQLIPRDKSIKELRRIMDKAIDDKKGRLFGIKGGGRKFGIDIESAKDITAINKKIRAKLEKAASYNTINDAREQSQYLYVLSFSPAWKKDLGRRLMPVRKRAKSEYCKTVMLANKQLKKHEIDHVVFSKLCKR